MGSIVGIMLTEDGEYCRNYAENLGAEGITDPTFTNNNLDGWTIINDGGASSVVVANNKATFDYVAADNTFLAIEHADAITVGEVSICIVDVESITGTVKVQDGDSDSSYGTISTTGVHIFMSHQDNAKFVIGRQAAGTDTNVVMRLISIKEATASEILNYATLPAPDIRALSTGLQTTPFKLDSIGMIEDSADDNSIRIAGSDEYVDSEFNVDGLTAYTIETKISGELQNFGSERVTNGEFDTDITGWSDYLPTGTMESSGGVLAINTTSNDNIYQAIMTVGTDYLISYEVISYTSGTPKIAGVSINTTVGTHTFVHTATSAELTIHGGAVGAGGVLSLDNISVKELTTTSQRTENRAMTLDSGTVKYFIETVLQDVTPPLPTGIIKGTNTAILGYPDEVNIIYDPLRIDLYARAQAEILEDHNALIRENEDVLTDDDGNYLTNDDGVYITT